MGTNDILIDPAYAKANKLKVGDSLNIYNKTFKISGFMSLPNYIYPLKTETDIVNDANNFGIAVISETDFIAVNKGNSFYSIKFNGNKSNLDIKISEFKYYLNNNNIIILNWMSATDNPRITYVAAKLEGISSISSSLPIVILLLTCILTGIVMWRMLKRESIIIGTLYALGYKKKQIKNHYLNYALSIALVGGIIGTALGALTLRPMINVMVSYFNMPVGDLIFSIKYLIMSILLPVISLSSCVYFVVSKALKSSPIELMIGGNGNSKVGLIERNLKLDKFNFSTKFRIREQLRSIPRSIFLLLGVVLATMLLLMGFVAKNSLDYLMKDGFNQAFKYNYLYVFNSIQRGTPSNGEAFSEVPFTLKSDNKISLTAYGINSDSKYITLKDKSGIKLTTDKVIVTRPLADKLNVKLNDTIKVTSKLDSKEYSITIHGIAETYVGSNIYIPLPTLNSMKIFL